MYTHIIHVSVYVKKGRCKGGGGGGERSGRGSMDIGWCG